jgi:hypothetical protein
MATLTLTLVQKIAVANALRPILYDRPGGLVEYYPGHGDQTVADSMQFRCNIGNVQSVRRSLYGRLYLRGPRSAAGGQDSSERMDAMERRIEALTERLASMEVYLSLPGSSDQ